MMKRTGLGILLAVALCLPAFGTEISDLKVEGNKRIDDHTIINATLLLPGDEYSPTGASEAVKKIYALGFFSEVSARADSSDLGVAITFVVVEKSTVARVEVLGNHKLKTNEILDSIQVREGTFLDRRAITRARDWIRGRYLEKGYVNVEVRDTLIESGEQYAVRFMIEEGRKVRTKQVVIEGNRALSDKAIIKALKTKPRGWGLVFKVIPWFRKGTFSEDTLKQDMERIQRLYKNNGYIEALAKLDSVSYTAEHDRILVHLTVSEGERYRIGQVGFEGNDKIKTARLERISALRQGAIYRIDDADRTIENLYNSYTEEGYIYCQVVPTEDLVDTTVNIKYTITENNQAYVNRIVIQGNTKTRDKVIRRQLMIKPGQLFRRSAVIRSQREIFSLGFFEDVTINYQPADTLGNIDLVFEVKEKQVGQFQIGTTYGATDGLAGFIQVGVPNLFGRGQEANVKTEFSNKKFNIELGFTEPWLFDSPTSAGFDLYHSSYDYTNYDQQRTGGSVRLGRPLPGVDYTRAYWEYRLERINVYNISTLYQEYYKDQQWPKMSSSTTLTLVRDSRDRPFNASSGTRTVTSSEFSGGILGGQVDFQKYMLEYRLYHPLFWKMVAMARAKGAMVDGYRNPNTVPVYELFYIGGVGDDGVRGYPDRGINVRGGRAMLVSNLEIKFSFTPSVYILAFADAGNSWSSVRKSQPANLYRGLGAGIRLEVPMLGILGLDYGYGLDRKKLGYRGNSEIHFQLGTTF